MKKLLFILLAIYSVSAFSYDEKRKRKIDYQYENYYSENEFPETRNCEASKEFINTLEFLRQQKHVDVVDKYAQHIAHEVSKGCTGSSERFINSFEVLMKEDAGFHAAVNISIKLSQKSDKYSEAFIQIFKRTYLKEYLDLDLMTSLQLANELSADYEGNIEFAVRDYIKLTEFCMSENHVGLSKPRCALITGRIVKRAASFDYPIAEPFIKAYTFIHENKLTGANVPRALSLSEEIVAISPKAVDNFIFAYQYGLKKKGLGINAESSLKFALDLSTRTVRGTPAQVDFDMNRIPASKEEPKANKPEAENKEPENKKAQKVEAKEAREPTSEKPKKKKRKKTSKVKKDKAPSQ